jgi:hypothetical protein
VCSCAIDQNTGGSTDPAEPVYQNETAYSCDVAWELQTYTWDNLCFSKLYGCSLYFITGNTSHGIPYVLNKVNLDSGQRDWQTVEIEGCTWAISKIDDKVFLFTDTGKDLLCFDDETGNLLATVGFDLNRDAADRKSFWMGSSTEYWNYLLWGNLDYLMRFDITKIVYDKSPDEIQIIDPEPVWGMYQDISIAATPYVENGVVYVLSTSQEPGENSIAAYDLSSDSLLWQRKTNKLAGMVIDGLKIEGDWLYIIDSDGSTCLNKYTGAERWVHNLDEKQVALYSGGCYLFGLWVDNGKIYYTNGIHSDTWMYIDIPEAQLKNIFCLDCATGKMVWADMPRPPCGSLGARPVVANGKAYVAHEEGLRIYDSSTGKLLGVDRSIRPRGRYSYNHYYKDKGYVIMSSPNDDNLTTRLVAIRAE